MLQLCLNCLINDINVLATLKHVHAYVYTTPCQFCTYSLRNAHIQRAEGTRFNNLVLWATLFALVQMKRNTHETAQKCWRGDTRSLGCTSLNQTNLILSQFSVIKRLMEVGGLFSREDRMVVLTSTKVGESMKMVLVNQRVSFGWGSAKSTALLAGNKSLLS